ncbi:MAG: cyclic pyranopterin monophosphate synthase MoaC [Planctomycetota bacterium]|jgi:cyclic pyranopterin phosphate synthase
MSNPSEDPIGPPSHLDADGNARMVDVGNKPVTVRTALAASRIAMSMDAANAIRENALSKGDALAVARIAAISAVKQTSHLIPLCHAILIDGVTVDLGWVDPKTLECRVGVRSTGKTGVEMEALTAASVAALAIYDMCKSIDRSMEIRQVRLIEKTGGQRGDFHRSE